MEDALTELAIHSGQKLFSAYLDKITKKQISGVDCKKDIEKIKQQYIQVVKDKLILDNQLKDCKSSTNNYITIIGILVLIIIIIGIVYFISNNSGNNSGNNSSNNSSKNDFYESPENSPF